MHVASATHNRAGEIRYQQLSDLTIKVELITYTKTSSIAADRDSILVMWGDGTFSNVDRTNGNGTILPNDTKKNVYQMNHTYPGRGEYTISMLDPNRIENILNVDPPNSISIPFFIQTKVKLFNTNFQGINNSPILTNPPLDIACLGQVFLHNPGAVDLDGDSLAYELITPLMDLGSPVPNYLYPNQIKPGLNNQIFFDVRTGNFIWNSPQLAGEYNIAIAIYEFRKGQLISTTIRDMQILVLSGCSDDQPPSISRIKDTCIIAGSFLNVDFIIDDPDRGKKGGNVKIQAYGAPFIIPPIATTSSNGQYLVPPYSFNLQWQTSCSHVQSDYYNIILKATDNFYDTTGLNNTSIYRVKVIGPPPLNLNATPSQSKIQLDWDYPYFCDTATSNFKGFSVWRSESPISFSDTCSPGLDKFGYHQISFLNYNLVNNRFSFTDSTAQKNHTYCYRIQAEYALVTESGFLYNFTHSLPSNEVCSKILTNEPFLINVSIDKTSISDGEVFIRYQKPFIPIFDTLNLLPPYTVKVFCKIGNNGFTELNGFTKVFNNFTSILDTMFIHTTQNTLQNKFSYYIELESANKVKLKSEIAEQIYLTALNFNKNVLLNWTTNTPWTNLTYNVLKRNNATLVYDSIGTTDQKYFYDRDIIMDSSYCYQIKSSGKYFDTRIGSPIINFSNEFCIKVIDSTPPCCPLAELLGPCELNNNDNKLFLRLSFNEDSCNSNDILYLNIYERIDGKLSKIISMADKKKYEYELIGNENLNNCYLIESFNKNNLTCITSPSCLSQCPEYILPNTFTPNGDSKNDYFTPIKNRQIATVEFIIINKWGNEVFRTNDPQINWDGKNRHGELLNDGTYYYTCKLMDAKTNNIKTITGFIELISGK